MPRPNPTIPTIALIDAPTDVGAGVRGAAMGPEALRVAGIGTRLVARGIQVVDAGTLAGPANPSLPPDDGHRHLEQVIEWNRAVHRAVAAQLDDDRLPLLLGGDHSLAMGSISAVAKHCRERSRTLRVLWIDAHADFNTSATTPSGNLHGMPVTCLCGTGPRALVELCGGRPDGGPPVDPRAFRHLGVRCVDPEERRLVHEAGIEVFDMRAIDELGMRRTMEMVLEGVDDVTHLHVSFDLDALDPQLAPGVGTPVPGGLTCREAQLCMEMIYDTGRLGSIDIVEVNPARDERNRTAELAVDLVESLFGKSTLMRRPSS